MLIDYIAEQFKKDHTIDLRKDEMALQRLKEAAERAKKDLSQQAKTDINLPFITADASGPKHLQMSITRSKFEQLVEPLVNRCRGPVLKALQDAGYKAGDIDEIVMVGGMTRMPKIQQVVQETFGKEGHRGVNPDEVVSIGAAIQGAQLLLGSKADVLLLDVTPLLLARWQEAGRPPQPVPTTFLQHALFYALHPERLAATVLECAGPPVSEPKAERTERLAELLANLGPERPVLFRNLTPPGLAAHFPEWVVWRVVIPGLQPLHGDHRLPFLGGPLWRPRRVAEWAGVPPHPFA